MGGIRVGARAWALAVGLAGALMALGCGQREKDSGEERQFAPPEKQVPLPPPPPPPPPDTPPQGGLIPDPARRFEWPPVQTQVETYGVEIDPSALATFYADRDAPEQPAVFVYEGKTQPILFRLRGNSSRGWPKKSWRVEFPEGVLFQGRRKLNLLSEWREQTMMVEKLGYDLLQAMHVPAPRAKYVRVEINGDDQGIYVDAQRVDKNFLRFHGFADRDGTIYRCGAKNCEMKTWVAPYQKSWSKETNELDPDNSALESIERAINYTPEPELVSMLESRLELEIWLRTMVMEALISNDTVEDSRSYFIYDAVTKRWSYAAWDLNNTNIKRTYGSDPDKTPEHDHPLFNFSILDGFVEQEYLKRASSQPSYGWAPIFSNLNTRIVFNPVLRNRLIALTERALDELFTVEQMNARIDETYRLLEPHMLGRPHIDNVVFQDSPRYLKEYVAARIPFIRSELARLKAFHQPLVIHAVDPNGGFVELQNRSGAPLSTAGLVLTTNLRDARLSNVPGRTLAPNEIVRFSSAELGLTLPREGEIGLFDGTRPLGVLDLLFYGAVPPGRIYARSSSDPSGWEIRSP